SRPDPFTLLPVLPPVVQAVLGRFLAVILAWVSALVYQALLLQCATHPLVRLAHGYDPAEVVAVCRDYYHQAGPGTPPTFAVRILVRAEIVRAWADSCSDRELEWQLASNLLVRWYIGLPLLGATPDHTTLNRFHAWLTEHHPDALFRDVLAFLDQVDPEDPAVTPQIVDTFAMASPAAPSGGPARLVLHLSARLATTWMRHAPPACQAALPPLDLGPLVDPPSPRTAARQQAQLVQAVTVANWLVAALTPSLPLLDPDARAAVQPVLDAIPKVIADEIITDASGDMRERPRDAKGSYRISSAVDLEATFRKHEPDPAVLGSNAMIATTATRIRAAVIRTGSTPDQVAPGAVLTQQREAAQPLPAVLIMDQAGGAGKTRAQVQTISAGQTQLVAQIPHTWVDGTARFTPADFQISCDGGSCTCPNGVTSQRVYRHAWADGVTFRFFGADCRGCPLWEACRGPTSKPNSQRAVYLTPFHTHLRQAAAFNATPEGQRLLQGRWQVEPTIAWLVRYNGCRQARRVGLAAAQCQLFQACAVRNLQLWLERLDRHQAPPPMQVEPVRLEVPTAA
ncbi:MAG: transposase, partial [Chloroflexota bacterium]|nr:transposase [Chloroflexota bacterium]